MQRVSISMHSNYKWLSDGCLSRAHHAHQDQRPPSQLVGKLLGAGLPPGPAPRLVRRVNTRPADPGGEDHEAVDVAGFERLRRAGQLAFWWSAHGLHYGVRHADLAPLAEGRWVVMNGSRAHLPALKCTAPGAHVVQVTAPAAVLAARLAARQRESAEAVAGRLGREVQTVPASLVVPNHGDLAETVACLHRWWEGLVRRAA